MMMEKRSFVEARLMNLKKPEPETKNYIWALLLIIILIFIILL